MTKNNSVAEVDKKVYLLGISFYLIGAVLAVIFIAAIIEMIFNHVEDIFVSMHLLVYFLFSAIVVFCGVSLKSLYLDSYSFFEDEVDRFNEVTYFQYTYIWCSAITGFITFAMIFFPNHAIGDYTLPIFGFAFIAFIVYSAIVFHYKKLVES